MRPFKIGAAFQFLLPAAITAVFATIGMSDVRAQDGRAGSTIAAIRQRGVLKCQVGSPTPGFFSVDNGGRWSGFFVDQCRALAVAIFNDPQKVEYLTVPTSARFSTLEAGESDILNDGVTVTATRDIQLGLTFGEVSLYDGQGLMVRADSGIKTAADLDGAAICMQTGGSTTERNVSDLFKRLKIRYTAVSTDSSTVMAETYLRGGCDAMVNDKSALIGRRASFPDPSAHLILPETISKEPLAAMMRGGDSQWVALVRWVLIGQIAAEELGVTSSNVDEMRTAADPAVLRLLGQESTIGRSLGVENTFMARIISVIGNYGQMYERNLGASTSVYLPRKGSLNALWSDGGLLYAYPFN